MINWLSSTIGRVLEKGLDTASLKHQVVSNNIANVDTPGFKRSGINFEDVMAQTLQQESFRGLRTDPRHIAIGEPNSPTPQIVTEKDTFIRNDGNNVDIEREMAELAENSLLYNSMAQLLNKRFGQLRSAINEGRR